MRAARPIRAASRGAFRALVSFPPAGCAAPQLADAALAGTAAASAADVCGLARPSAARTEAEVIAPPLSLRRDQHSESESPSCSGRGVRPVWAPLGCPALGLGHCAGARAAPGGPSRRAHTGGPELGGLVRPGLLIRRFSEQRLDSFSGIAAPLKQEQVSGWRGPASGWPGSAVAAADVGPGNVSELDSADEEDDDDGLLMGDGEDDEESPSAAMRLREADDYEDDGDGDDGDDVRTRRRPAADGAVFAAGGGRRGARAYDESWEALRLVRRKPNLADSEVANSPLHRGLDVFWRQQGVCAVPSRYRLVHRAGRSEQPANEREALYRDTARLSAALAELQQQLPGRMAVRAAAVWPDALVPGAFAARMASLSAALPPGFDVLRMVRVYVNLLRMQPATAAAHYRLQARQLVNVLQVTPAVADRMIQDLPQLLTGREGKIESEVAALRAVFPATALPRLLRTYPNLLSRTPQTLAGPVSTLKELLPGVDVWAKKFLRFPRIFSATPHTMVERVRAIEMAIREHGDTIGQPADIAPWPAADGSPRRPGYPPVAAAYAEDAGAAVPADERPTQSRGWNKGASREPPFWPSGWAQPPSLAAQAPVESADSVTEVLPWRPAHPLTRELIQRFPALLLAGPALPEKLTALVDLLGGCVSPHRLLWSYGELLAFHTGGLVAKVEAYVAANELGGRAQVQRMLASRLMMLTKRPEKVLQGLKMLQHVLTEAELAQLKSMPCALAKVLQVSNIRRMSRVAYLRGGGSASTLGPSGDPGSAAQSTLSVLTTALTSSHADWQRRQPAYLAWLDGPEGSAFMSRMQVAFPNEQRGRFKRASAGLRSAEGVAAARSSS